MYDGNELMAKQAYAGEAQPLGRLSCKARIDVAVKQAEERLAKVKEAKEILDRNPDLERLLDIMQQSHF